MVEKEYEKGLLKGYEQDYYIAILGKMVILFPGKYKFFSLIKDYINLFLYRDKLFSTLQNVDPIGVESRKHDLNWQRGEYIIPGPNKIWSVDGYHKLIEFGFEIYAGIDGYFRYVPWSYVGVSTQTEISIYCQYLEVINNIGYMPSVIQSDHGSETLIRAEANFQLCLGETDEQEKMTEEQAQEEFRRCYYYGTST